MTVLEAKNEFNTFFNNIASNRAPGIDDYELSVLFTTAQNQLVKELYNGGGASSAFEESEEVRRYLNNSVKQKDYTSGSFLGSLSDDRFKHSIFTLPSNCWYIVFEQITAVSDKPCRDGKVLDVFPVQHDDYLKTRENPFRGPNDRRVLRLDKGENQVEIVSKDDIGLYTIRYVAEPKPIVVSDLDGDSVDSQTKGNTVFSELPTSLHRIIVMRAVQIAAATIEGIIKKTN